jgi:hypothetical protein
LLERLARKGMAASGPGARVCRACAARTCTSVQSRRAAAAGRGLGELVPCVPGDEVVVLRPDDGMVDGILA